MTTGISIKDVLIMGYEPLNEVVSSELKVIHINEKMTE